MSDLSLKEKVDIVYNASHGKPNDMHSKSEVTKCTRKYVVPYKDTRATKKNIEQFIRQKDNGFRKDFNDFCYEKNLADGRKTRNGKKEYENSLHAQLIQICALLFVNYCALVTYDAKQFLPFLIVVQLVIWKVLGRRKGIIGAVIFLIVFCQIAYRM